MAYPDDNKQTQVGLNIRYNYTSKLVDVTGSGVWAPLYCITRIATKQYSYVGLTYSQATALQATKIGDYTRESVGWKLTGNEQAPITYESSAVLGADVQVVHTGGDMWQLDINVNEQNDVWTFVTPSPSHSVSSIFNAVLDTSNWTYDE